MTDAMASFFNFGEKLMIKSERV